MKKVNLHFRRFEFKYPIPRVIADRILHEVLKYMVWDEYVGDGDYYTVNTLYMDSADFISHHEKLDGLQNREKLRARVYEDFSGDVFLELKRKRGDVIFKDRIVVEGADFKEFLDDPFVLMRNEKYRGAFLEEFLYQYSTKKMSPVLVVSYKRRPLFAKSGSAFRVTFDYDLKATSAKELKYVEDYDKVFYDLVVMEVKFNGAMPGWFHDIIERFELTKDTFSKYCAAAEACYGLPSYY